MLDRVLSDGSSRWTRLARLAGLLAVTAALAAPSAVRAQEGGEGQGQTLRELRQISQQLQTVRKQALQDSALRVQRKELTAYLRSEMKSLDDSTSARVDRMMELQDTLVAAQQARDTAGARSAMRELKKLQRATMPARKKVMMRPEVQKRIKAFQEAVRAKMREISPQADSLLDRADSLQAELRGGMGGASGGAEDSGG